MHLSIMIVVTKQMVVVRIIDVSNKPMCSGGWTAYYAMRSAVLIKLRFRTILQLYKPRVKMLLFFDRLVLTINCFTHALHTLELYSPKQPHKTMSQVNTRRVPSHTFLCCIPVRVGVVVSFAFYYTYNSSKACGLVPFPYWRIRRRCNGSLCDYPDETLTYECLAYQCCACQTHQRFLAGTTGNKVALIIQIIIYLLLAILSIFGFVYVLVL